MPTSKHVYSRPTLIVICLLLLLVVGGLNPASAQLIAGLETSRPDRLPPPRTAGNVKQNSSDQHIALGNRARDAGAYTEAFDQYRQAQSRNVNDARVYYGFGNLYFETDCYDEAITSYGKAIALKKDYLEARIGLGFAYIEEDRLDEAREQFLAVFNKTPYDINANTGLATVDVRRGDYAKAVAQLKSLVDSKAVKDQAAVSLSLGDIYFLQGSRIAEAIEEYKKAIRLKPDFWKAYLKLAVAYLIDSSSHSDFLNEPNTQATVQASARQAAAAARKAIESHYDPPEVYFVLGFALAVQAQFQEANNQIRLFAEKSRELLDQLGMRGPTKCSSGLSLRTASEHVALGWIAILESALQSDKTARLTLLDQASSELIKARDIKPSMPEVYLALGALYTIESKYQDSIGQYETALRFETKEPARSTEYENIAINYLNLNEESLAIENFREAIKHNPTKPLAYKMLGALLLKQGKVDETIALLKSAKANEAESPVTYFDLSIAFSSRYLRDRKEEDFNQAVTFLNNARGLKPDYPEVYVQFGNLYVAQNKADDALENFDKASGYRPNDPNIYLAKASVYSALKHNNDAAIQQLKKAIQVKSDFAPAYFAMGQLFRQEGKTSDAIEQLEKSVSHDASFLPPYFELGTIYRGQKNFVQALNWQRKAIGLAPTSFFAHKEIAKTLEEQGNSADAIKSYQQAIDLLGPVESSVKRLYLGRIARLRGNYPEAITYFHTLGPPLGPDQTYYDLGVTYVLMRDKRAALEQHGKLVGMNSVLAQELFQKITEMK
ncbi:MAG TPA: tetratricopeptide repeat protein [Pyrinomonadaceae bacterium]|nr:tetratricopeptide repeat protein [Pyrinomonadaceae bacterium]